MAKKATGEKSKGKPMTKLKSPAGKKKPGRTSLDLPPGQKRKYGLSLFLSEDDRNELAAAAAADNRALATWIRLVALEAARKQGAK